MDKIKIGNLSWANGDRNSDSDVFITERGIEIDWIGDLYWEDIDTARGELGIKKRNRELGISA